MALQSLQLSLPRTPPTVIGAADLELVHLTNLFFIHYVLEFLPSAVRACLPSLRCAKPVCEAGGTEVLATAGSKVSITKDLGTDGADVLAGNTVHKVIFIATMVLVPARDVTYFLYRAFSNWASGSEYVYS